MIVQFKPEKVTKNTIKFTEILESDLDTAKIGALYVQKATLKEMGWQEGKVLSVSIEISK